MPLAPLNDFESDSLVLENRYLSAFEGSLTAGYFSFIENCSNSITSNKSLYSFEDIKKITYIFKFLKDQWLLTDKDIRALKKTVLERLFLLFLTKKKIKNKKQIIDNLVYQIGEKWCFCEEDFPYLDDEEKNDLKKTISISPSNETDSMFADLKFVKRIPSNDILQIFPDFFKKIEKTYADFNRKIDCYKNEDQALIKSIFISIIENKLQEDYPGYTKFLTYQFFLSEIDIINNETFDIRNSDSDMKVVFRDLSSCYVSNKIYIKNSSDRHQSLPDWALWFFKAGQRTALLPENNTEIVIGFSLPSRSYAALFFLLGYETESAIRRMGFDGSNNEYFHSITGMEQSTPLLIWDNDRWKRCFSKGIMEFEGQKMFSVSVPGTENRRHDRIIPEAHIHLFREAVHPERKVGDHQVGYAMRGFDFFRNYYCKNEKKLLKYLIESKDRFTIVGNKTTLKNEIDNLPVYLNLAEDWLEGSIQDIIRLDNYLFSEYDLSKGTVLSSDSLEDSNHQSGLVVFDGSMPFLKHFDDIECDKKIVFLDRCDHQFSTARNVFIDQHYSDRENDEEMILLKTVPETIEMIMFEV
ncbi:hypothetical protein [Desulfobacula sp.]|uniref:hypothetical protein n=1 Tax=Desulfobacula sp. TaxID=2593537 RepID=UPI0025BC709E|nr:hypothetical protein [Desulfobacula sp.]MBC2705602.1 hypothetical protein [Desulfobacula sp.]